MFTDWSEAFEAESLPLDPTTAQQRATAARVTARSSHDKHDMTLLLDMLGLPTNPDMITALLPLIPETGDAPTMTNTPAAPALSAFEAMAISMHNNGDSEQTIREATGLSETELRDLIAAHAPGQQPDSVASPALIDTPVVALPVSNTVQELLDWAAAHTAAGVRSRAARVTTDLSELPERRDSEAAQREAEEKVAKAKAELEKAQEALRTVKVGTRTTTLTPSGRAWAAAAPGRSSPPYERGRARTATRSRTPGWCPSRVLQAYDAAHQAPVRKAG
ncbi:Lsr2 family DNA-binding protein [Streptomyces sp. SAI-25]|uniref:Lsr2 family DNA-binding protein n=1 Tax=Streptomyces sp. SAI-25 TaxID=1472664 RepID=UPI0040392352